ncbi:hypothetical protein GCM10009716_24080 [Streptomyces sodiiphilus]|uniref:Uncharacterized protein n=1 Tax=Streptomyces sodiiphilus TaxID=226217 RepID=A0ABN2P6J0_9ACTN
MAAMPSPHPVSASGRIRHTTRNGSAARKHAAEALQRALDRRDNGGATGH